jgi:hypothetical protein
MAFFKDLLRNKAGKPDSSKSKTCSVCGNPNKLDARFCSSCGNEFRTVSEVYDGFISYRRETGSDLASLFKIQLESRFHKQIFLDVKELQVGRFDEKLLQTIEKTPNFIVILSRSSLDRCVDKSDWLKREIMHAIETGCNIIPVLTGGFEFPSEKLWALLPEEMRLLSSLNGVIYSHIHQDAAIRNIASYMKTEAAIPSRESAFSKTHGSPKPVNKEPDQQPSVQTNTIREKSNEVAPPLPQQVEVPRISDQPNENKVVKASLGVIRLQVLSSERDQLKGQGASIGGITFQPVVSDQDHGMLPSATLGKIRVEFAN